MKLTTKSANETVLLGKRIGKNLGAGHVLCLSGSLGAGKTHLTRGLALGWGTTDHPTSPTFGLVNQYQRPQDDQKMYHIDCYRLASAEEVWTVGFSDILDDPDAIIVIEWPERIASVLPPTRLWITITTHEENTRHFDLQAIDPQSEALIAALQNSV